MGKLWHDGFAYWVTTNLKETLWNLYYPHLGEFKPIGLPDQRFCDLMYFIEDGGLYLKEMTVCVKEDEMERFQLTITPDKIEHKEILIVEEIDIIKRKVCCMQYKRLHQRIPYAGILISYQFYVDEMEFPNGVRHKDENFFFFEEGKLNESKSTICKSGNRYLDRILWNETNRMEYIEHIKEQRKQGIWKFPHKYFLVETTVGSIRQAEAIMSCVLGYKTGSMDNEMLEKTLTSFKHPAFRLQMMSEVTPGSGDFKSIELDLIKETVNRRDQQLLKRLYPYIDMADYKAYKEEILALLND